MRDTRDNPANEVIASGWFTRDVLPWVQALWSMAAILTYREALRLLILARQLGG